MPKKGGGSTPFLPDVKAKQPAPRAILFQTSSNPVVNMKEHRAALHESLSSTTKLQSGFSKSFPKQYEDTRIGSLYSKYNRMAMTTQTQELKETQRAERKADAARRRAYKQQTRARALERQRKIDALRNTAATKIQMSIRRYQALVRVKAVWGDMLNEAASRIQGTWKKFWVIKQAKAELFRRREAFEQECAANAIQRRYVGFSDRKVARQVLKGKRVEKQRVLEEVLKGAQSVGATRIQSLARGIIGRERSITQKEKIEQQRLLQLQETQLKAKVEADLRRKK